MKFTVSTMFLASSGILAVSGNVIPLEAGFNKRQPSEVGKLQVRGWLDNLINQGKDIYNEAKDSGTLDQ
ncbi:hypothetical protein BB560_003064, partial [Smittium megazygosporum]